MKNKTDTKKAPGTTAVTVKIGLLMAVAVALLLATGYLAYRNLSAVVASIRLEDNPEMMLVEIRKISMELEQAENSIRLYMITGDTSDLRPYYRVLSTIDGRMNALRGDLSGDPVLLSQADTISKLIEESMVIWNELLYLNRNEQVIGNLRQLSDSLHVSSQEEAQQERGILGRVFRRNRENQPDRQALIEDLQQIEEQDRVTQQRQLAREYELALTGTRIRERFYEMIARLEAGISGLIAQKATSAGALAGKTYRWLAFFSVSGTILAILVLFLVVRYVRKTRAYQAALEHSREQAENLARTKEMFMANMSHELRTPVTAISGFAEQLQHGNHDEKTGRIIDIIKSSSDHLVRVIGDILDFSRLQQDKMTLEKTHFRIRQVMEEVFEMFGERAGQNNTELDYSIGRETPEVLLGDPHRLKQILINLVSNAVKFTRGGHVRFGINSLPVQNNHLELILEVTDTGIGIEEDRIRTVFEDFTQEENSITRQYGGTGLGLSIVKELVELHGGTIDLRSRKGHGTRITCRLPYLKGDRDKIGTGRPPAVPDATGSERLKVLVVDDEEYNRMLFRAILERMHVAYHEAVDGATALDLLRKEKYDLMFMDVRMPGMDGLEVTRIIREQRKISSSEMPIICISAASVSQQWPDYERAGMDAFLSKPFTEQELRDVIRSIMGNGSPAGEELPRTGTDHGTAGSDRLDLHGLYQIAGGDEQFVRQMLQTFAETTQKGLKEMHLSLVSGNLEGVAYQAHQLLPPGRHLGAARFCHLLEQIESHMHQRVDTVAVKRLVGEAFREFEKIEKLLEATLR